MDTSIDLLGYCTVLSCTMDDSDRKLVIPGRVSDRCRQKLWNLVLVWPCQCTKSESEKAKFPKVSCVKNFGSGRKEYFASESVRAAVYLRRVSQGVSQPAIQTNQQQQGWFVSQNEQIVMCLCSCVRVCAPEDLMDTRLCQFCDQHCQSFQGTHHLELSNLPSLPRLLTDWLI